MIATALAALAALAAASQAPVPAPAPRPAAELRCIYETAPEAAIVRVGEMVWTRDAAQGQPVQLLITPGRACMSRHGWGGPEVQQAVGYALGTAAVRHVRTQLAQSLPVARWDAIYEAAPVAERLRRTAPPEGDSLSRGIARAMAEDRAAWTARPDTARLAINYFVARAMAERAEREWAGLANPD